MDSQLKQRLIGAAVLVALAVIFLPMLVKGPAPDSGVSDVSLKVPDAPQGEYETRDLPLVVPDEAPAGGVVGLQAPDVDDGALPTVDTTTAPSGRDTPQAGGPDAQATMLPPTAAGGDYAVHFAAYDSSVSADTVVARLRDARLPAYREASQVGDKQAWRVRIGPYATRADAEIARVEAARAGKYAGARVIALDAAEPAAQVAAKPAPEPVPPARPAPAEPVASKPAEKPAEAPKPATKPVEPPKPAATAGVGFAVQIGAFSNAAQATAKRDELRAAGFSAFTETVQTDKGTLTRVLAGPVVSRPEAEQLNGRLRARLGISNGLVRSHP
ncbi:SPOR domain-containing protein [Luteimonas soli]|uniref:SPOR domain-containing protein n=1 Tax=Luteimonas soli TaxID=1648966 RepID=A0ABV7XN97_9GAMM